MIPYKSLLQNPDDYQYLGSRRSVHNVPSEEDYVYVDLKKAFFDKDNLVANAQNIYRVYYHNGGQLPRRVFTRYIIRWAKEFCAVNNLDEYRSVEYQAVGFSNHVDLLKSINIDFQKFCYNALRWNVFVPSRMHIAVGPSDARKEKPLDELTAEDIGTVDVWAQQEISITSKAFRDHNRIPFYQYTMHNRHYDRGNDGLHHESDRASLENYQRTFDMQPIYAALDKYHTDDWFGF